MEKKLDEFESRIEGELTDAVLAAEQNLAAAYKDLADFYDANGYVEAALAEYLLVRKYNAAGTTIPTKIVNFRRKLRRRKPIKRNTPPLTDLKRSSILSAVLSALSSAHGRKPLH